MAVTLNDITKYIKFNNTNIKFSLNTNSEFEQSFNIPDKVLDPNLCLNDLTNNIEDNGASSNNIFNISMMILLTYQIHCVAYLT